jgi:DnaK suppressor protein
MTSRSQTPSSTYLTAADLAEFGAALREQRRFRFSQLEGLASTTDDAADSSADVAEALKRAAEHALAQIDRALEHLENGGYGRCLVCGRPIARARLEVIPAAVLCVACQRRADADLPLRQAPRTVDDLQDLL